MTPLTILNKKEKQEIINKLKEQFGIESIPGEIITRGGERLFLYSGNLDSDFMKKLEEITFIERIGIYFAKVEENGEIRLSIEGTQILQNQISKNVFELDEKQAEEWMKGHELNIQAGIRGFVVMKCGNDFLGTGKASENKITNFIPKNRRLRERG